MTTEEILTRLPYEYPFLFVDTIDAVDEQGITGSFTFDKNLDFYKGHFKGRPITPGVLLTEVMAQIGLVCLGIFLLGKGNEQPAPFALTQTNINFYNPVYPDQRVVVRSIKEYFRFGKLKCSVSMRNEEEEIVCDGFLSGMTVTDTKWNKE